MTCPVPFLRSVSLTRLPDLINWILPGPCPFGVSSLFYIVRRLHVVQRCGFNWTNLLPRRFFSDFPYRPIDTDQTFHSSFPVSSFVDPHSEGTGAEPGRPFFESEHLPFSHVTTLLLGSLPQSIHADRWSILFSLPFHWFDTGRN